MHIEQKQTQKFEPNSLTTQTQMARLQFQSTINNSQSNKSTSEPSYPTAARTNIPPQLKYMKKTLVLTYEDDRHN